MKVTKAPPSTRGVRQQPVGTNHFQFRLHQPGCGGGWATVSMPLFSAKKQAGVEHFLKSNAVLHCARENGSLTSRPMKILFAVLSALLLATGSVRAAEDTVLLNTLGYT